MGTGNGLIGGAISVATSARPISWAGATPPSAGLSSRDYFVSSPGTPTNLNRIFTSGSTVSTNARRYFFSFHAR